MRVSYKRAISLSLRCFANIGGLGSLLIMLLVLYIATANAQEDVAAQVLERINRARADANLPALTRNAQLDAAAQGHANDLLQNGAELGHRGSDGSTIRQRIARAGFAGDTVGENWAAFRALDTIMEFWLNDPPHRKNILHGKFREIGIGVATRPNGGLIIVTDFGAQGNNAELFAAAPTAAPKKVRPAQAPTKAKPKPTQAPPTRKSTRKPTAAPIALATPLPPVTQVAIVQAPLQKSVAPMRARGKVKRLALKGNADASLGKVVRVGDTLHKTFGGALMAGGAVLFGVAVIGQRRRKTH